PASSPEQLLAMAVSGWFLGSVSAENKVDTALRLWRARQFILAYERTMDYQTRRRNLTTFVQNGGVAFDEVDRLLKAIPPAEPFDLAGGNSSALAFAGLPFVDNTVALAVLTAQRLLANGTYELQASLPWSFRKGANYLVQLPPEYHAGRHYPVLFVLHEAGERPEDMLRRWSFLAAQHGYFLVAPEWENHAAPGYHFSHDEQRSVLDVLRHLRQHFQVDSDRVFLTGQGEGGTMAFDVGLAHPDCFAGVMPMGGRPRYFAKAYWQNAQYLPFYVIDGDLDGDAAKDLRRQFEQWIPKGYPSLYVQYKGRGSEWFGGEVPYLFDWMGRKKRAAAFPELGRSGLGSFGEEFQSMRPMDNHFYWLEGQDLKDRHVNDGRSWSNKVTAAKLQARIKDNDIFVNTQGFRLVTVWLGQGMIDFEKPVKMTLNAKVNFGVRKIAPNLETLLEDFYQRADRQRPFLAKVELPVP
ncbi:MAG: hypothetical protein E6K70_14400, partial [Planctomycetota bacterium]